MLIETRILERRQRNDQTAAIVPMATAGLQVCLGPLQTLVMLWSFNKNR